MDSMKYDQQGNILAQNMQKLDIKKGMQKSPSAVFAWPPFINNTITRDIMNPLQNVIQVRSTDCVRSVLWTLTKNKVQCVPVYNEANRKYIGFIDMFDIVKYIFNAAGPAVVRPDFFQAFKKQSFGDVQINKIIDPSSKDHSTSITDYSSLGALFDLTVATNLQLVPVMNKHRVQGLVSQARMVKFLAENVAKFSGELALVKLTNLGLSGTDNVYTVEENAPTISAFGYMLEKGVRGLAVVDAQGTLVDAINSFDVKGLVHGDFFSDLRQPVLRFLSKSRILLGKNLAPIVCTCDDTLSDALQRMAQERVSRVFVIDADRKPVQVISLRDILKLLHAHSNPQPPKIVSAGSGGQ